MASQTKILCVDDEPRVLEGLELQLGWDYEVHLAESGETGLKALDAHGPFSVVISDMRMPSMNGATFLGHVRECDPDASRMLLTGFADVDSAAEAVNRGQVFRFLQKPCVREELLTAVSMAVEHHRLVTAERSLLEDTLNGAIVLLTEILSLTAPLAFSRSSHISAYVKHIVGRLELQDAWRFEVAALLSRLGCVTIPPDTLQRLFAGQPLSPRESEMMNGHSKIGRDLVAHIPRLELVSEMIAAQQNEIGELKRHPTTDAEHVALGGALLRLSSELDARLMVGITLPDALEKLARERRYPPFLLEALTDFTVDRGEEVVRAVTARELQPFMVLDEDVLSNNGNVVVPRGRELDRPILERLKNFAQGVGLREPIRVRIRTDVVDRCGI